MGFSVLFVLSNLIGLSIQSELSILCGPSRLSILFGLSIVSSA